MNLLIKGARVLDPQAPETHPRARDIAISGDRIVDVGQKSEEYPLEIHVAPRFDPAAIAKELDLQPPVHVSERNVLYCKEDWCELHPRG